MAYTTNTLSILQGSIGGRGRWWTYESVDSLATILGAGYLSDAANKRLQVGDIIFTRFGTLNTTGPDQVPSTHARGTVSEFSVAPGFEVLEVDAVTSGAATLKTARTESITDSSGGTASATAGVVAALAKQTLVLPVAALAGLVNAQVRKLVVPFAFSVTSMGFRVGTPATTAAKLATLTAQVAGTPVTGGVAALTSANCTPTGALVASSAITALNVGTAGQTLEAAVSAVTAFVEGDGHIEFGVTNNDLANAIATMIKF